MTGLVSTLNDIFGPWAIAVPERIRVCVIQRRSAFTPARFWMGDSDRRYAQFTFNATFAHPIQTIIAILLTVKPKIAIMRKFPGPVPQIGIPGPQTGSKY